MSRNHEEHDMQKAFIYQVRKIPGCEWFYAIPNAVPVRTKPGENEKLARIKAQRYATAEGRLPGVLDTCLLRAIRNKFPSSHEWFHCLYHEFKLPGTIVNGKERTATKLSEKQARFVIYADSQGYAVAVSRSVQEAMETTLRYLHGEHSNESALQEARAVLTPRVKVKK